MPSHVNVTAIPLEGTADEVSDQFWHGIVLPVLFTIRRDWPTDACEAFYRTFFINAMTSLQCDTGYDNAVRLLAFMTEALAEMPEEMRYKAPGGGTH